MLLAKIIDWIRNLLVRFFWPREAVSNIQIDVITILAESRMQHEVTMSKLNKLGAQMSEATDVLDRIDARTNEVGALVRELRDELANTSDASPEVLARLDAVADALDGIAADPNNPVPDPGGDNIPPLEG